MKSIDMNEQLKPCPFCGSKNVYMPHIGGGTIEMVRLGKGLSR